MNENFFEYLYVSGQLDKDMSLSTQTINYLYNTYNRMFPNNPLDDDFFFNSEDDQIRLLSEAIENNSPICKTR